MTSDPESPQTVETSVSDNTLEIMSSLMDEIHSLKDEKEKLADSFNKFRLMMFPRSIPELHDSVRQVQFSWLDLVKQDPTLELIGLQHKLYLELASLMADFVEEHRSKLKLKIDATATDKKKKKEVETDRLLPKTVNGRIKLSTLDKALDGFRKMVPGLSQTDLVKMIQSVPMYSAIPENDIRTSLEKLFARDAQKG